MAIDLHPGQSRVFRDLFITKVIKYAVVCCARGWGKSYKAGVDAANAIFELMEMPDWVPHKTVYIIAPTYDQVTEIYYPLLAWEIGLENYATKYSQADGYFKFPGGVELRLLSYESVERMRGKGAYFVVWDEVSSCKKGIKPKEAWQSVIQPCLVTRWSPLRAASIADRWHRELLEQDPDAQRPDVSPGRALFISTPKGYNYFYDLFHKKDVSDDWEGYHFDYHSSPFLDPNEIEKIRAEIDPIEFASEYLASFEDSGNNVFYMFDRKVHVHKGVEDFAEGEDVHVAIDFNVGLQCSSAWALRGGTMQCIQEFKGHPDTETLAISLATTFKGHKIYAYPDPSGRARKTSAPVGRTDFSILESHGITCLAREKAPPIVDSANSVNRMLKTADGQIRTFVHPRCVGVTMSLERTKWVDGNPDTATIDKKDGVEHFSDGIRYLAEYRFPVLVGTKTHHRSKHF